MSQEIERSYSSSPLESRMQYAKTLASAGSLIPSALHDGGAPNPGKVLLVMETGAMLGLHPVAALQGVQVIEGKAVLSPALMSAVVRRAGHDLRVTTSGSIKSGDFIARAELVREDDVEHPFVVEWSVERALRAKLVDKYEQQGGVWTITALRGRNNNPSPWMLYPEAMMKARAISEVCREGATDALMGVGYVPEELGGNVDEQGELVDEPQQQQRQQQSAPPAAEPSKKEDIVDAEEVVDEPPAEPKTSERPNQSAPIASEQTTSRDWRADADAAPDAETVLDIFNQCRDAGELGQMTEWTNEKTGEVEDVQLRVYLRKLGMKLREAEASGGSDAGAPAVLAPDEHTKGGSY